MSDLDRSQRDSFAGWLADINQICGAFDGEAIAPGFKASIEEYQQGALKMSLVGASHLRLLRRPEEVARTSSHHYYAVFQLAGSARMAQGNARETLEKGDIIFIDNTHPSEFTYCDASRQLSLILPYDLVGQTLAHRPVEGGYKIAAGVAVAGLATQLLLATRAQGTLSLLESEAVLHSTLNLLRPALLARPEQEDPHEKMFRKSLELIDRHIREPELSPDFVAQKIGVSMRGLYRIFGKHGLVVAQYIKHRRLDLCAQALRQAPGSDKLAVVGYSWGFSNSSYFTTAFKARFGVSPSEYRKRYH